MKYRVTHISRYSYGSPVDLAAHMLHLRPRPLPWQTILAEEIDAEPGGARRRDGLDHFGNVVTWLFLDRPHADFVVTARSTVEVAYPAPPAETPAWEDVAAAARQPDAGPDSEYRFGSPLAPIDPGTLDLARAAFPPGRPVLEAVLSLNRTINREFAFRAGVTTV